MSQRTARIISRSLSVFVVVLVIGAFATGAALVPRADTGAIVVVPAGLQERVERAADTLRADPNAQIDPTLADAPQVYLDMATDHEEGRPLVPDSGAFTGLFTLVVALLWCGTGAAIVSRQPRNWAGWLFIAIGVGLPATFALSVVTFIGVKAVPGSVPLLDIWAVVGEFAIFPIALIPFLWLLFPDGRPPSRRWRPVIWAFAIALTISLAAGFLDPGPLNNFVDAGVLYMNPIGVDGVHSVTSTIQAIGGIAAVLLAIATIFGVRGRFKRSIGEERQQLRWLVFVTMLGLALLLVISIAGIIAEDIQHRPEPMIGGVNVFDVLFSLVFMLFLFGIPAVYLIAIFRYGLWNLDVVIKKTAQYGVLFGAMILIAASLVIAIPALVLGSAIDVGFWLTILLAVILAGAFSLIRSPARRLADRIVYGRRATPYEVLSAFSERVGETYAADDVLQRMATALGEGTAAERATVWLRIGTELRPAAVWPTDTDMPERPPVDSVEVVHQGDSLGALSVSMPTNDPMNPAKQKLIEDLAGQAGLVLRNVRLIAELRDSRRRIVTAQDVRAKQLERNIHDGAQQQLVALSVKLRLAQQLAERDPAKVGETLAQLQDDATDALENLRDLARGIYPPLLADKGLAAALEAQARKAAVPITIEADGIGRFPQEVESAVYFSCLEALQNVAKYAEATRATIVLTESDGSLRFTVTDDGKGFDPSSTGYGTGLQGIEDRLDAIGGSLEVTSAPGQGTSVVGTVLVS